MNINQGYAYNPVGVTKSRSKFYTPYENITTFNSADLVPFYMNHDVLPGSTYSVDTSLVIRMLTPVTPVMGNCFLDIYYFFVPDRLVWSDFKKFMGENEDSYWYPDNYNYTEPQLNIADVKVSPDSIINYMGIPAGREYNDLDVSVLPVRAYNLIWNEFFRDENTTAPVLVKKDNAMTYYDSDSSITGGKCLKVCKYHDRFTSCLPSPQRGPAVTLPLGSTAPLVTSTSMYKAGNYPAAISSLNIGSSSSIYVNGYNHTNANSTSAAYTNLYADLSSATAATINELRMAFAIQRYYETTARSGGRYIEQVRALFGVTSPDARQQRPEFLGGKRIPINMNQVIQTSETTSTNNPLGQTGAFSCTGDSGSTFTYSATEHGTIIGVCCVRTEHIYQDGIHKQWTRKRKFDRYIPQFAHISEQAVLRKELYVLGDSDDETVFGYQEAWSEYRHGQAYTSGYMNSNVTGNLSQWHYADHFTTPPVLNNEFMFETPSNIDRTIQIESSTMHQFLMDVKCEIYSVLPMPINSIPGLLDHC